ncbi:unnamed protein product [Caenorhabditis angaria]|uniref:Tyrosine-protein kinase n=1 Tax=Caenorhabditis angaria TaxID=860376 RepID=A0A9P1MYC1_9PELO|nr:unnamed protein product [Caenorhabditis angaria]
MITKDQNTKNPNFQVSFYATPDETATPENNARKNPTPDKPSSIQGCVTPPVNSAPTVPQAEENPQILTQIQPAPEAPKMKDRDKSRFRSKNRTKKKNKRPSASTEFTENDEKTSEEKEQTENDDFFELEKKLRDFDFYHGFLPREDLSTLLTSKGDFVLRVSEVQEDDKQKVKREVILSLIPVGNSKASETKPHKNVIIKRAGKMFFIEKAHPFEDVKELLNYYKKNQGTCNKITFQLKNPILLQPWEFMHSDVLIGNVLGEGAFGKVTSGCLKLKDGTMVDVAVKMTKGTAFLSKAKIREMMNEARFIRNFNHKNVVRLYGVAHDEQPLYILLELVKGGSLKSHLAKNKTTLSEKMKHCLGSARGIEYLHVNKCIHRDIAARNCLLSDGVIKITDFGLSRTGPSYKLRTSCKLPTRWLSPEVLTTLTFSYGSDVYSYAVMVYEIFTDGGEPFENQSNANVKAEVLAGRYLQMPQNCPEPLKVLISSKVFVENSKRASMTEVANEVEKLSTQIEEGHGRFNITKNLKNLNLKKKIFKNEEK